MYHTTFFLDNLNAYVKSPFYMDLGIEEFRQLPIESFAKNTRNFYNTRKDSGGKR